MRKDSVSNDNSQTSFGLGPEVKEVLASFPTGVCVVTVTSDGSPYGLAVSAFSSVSLSPASILVCINQSSATHDRLRLSKYMGVNVLAHDQMAVAGTFSKSGGDKFADLAWHPGEFGSPLLQGAAAYMEIELEKHLTAHTHSIFIGRIVGGGNNHRPPLIYKNSAFFDGAQLLAAS